MAWLCVLLTMTAWPCANHADEVDGQLNGTWQLDAKASDELDEVADKLNAELNERDRARRRDEKDRKNYSGSNRYQRQMDAVNEMIREDNRSRQWGGPPEVRAMIEAERIKLYVANRVVVLYDDARRRLLTVNLYKDSGDYDADLILGPQAIRRWTGFHPIIAEFLAEELDRVDSRKREISEEEWERAYRMGQEYQEARPGLARDGRPVYASIPASRPESVMR